MTLVAAWLRNAASRQELVVATDSRLNGGEAWNSGPKLFPLTRGDAVFAFAGSTHRSYPLIVQASRWAEDYDKARVRAMDLHDFKGHAERLMTSMLSCVDLSKRRPKPKYPEVDCTIVLAGYSARKRQFHIWGSHYDSGTGTFRFTRVGGNVLGSRGKHVAFIGDSVVEAKLRLRNRLRALGKMTRGGLDWEPLEVLRDMCREAKFESIGGPIQVAKVYDYMTTMPYAVRWRESDEDTERGYTSLFGRRLLDYERTQRLVLDVDSLQVSPGWHYLDECTGGQV